MNTPVYTASMPHPPPPPSKDADTAATQEAIRLFAKRPELSQRQLSQALGSSVGKTRAVVHALLDRWLVKVLNLKRSDNKLADAYPFTSNGLSEKQRLTLACLVRTEAEFKQPRSTPTPTCVRNWNAVPKARTHPRRQHYIRVAPCF